MVKALLSFLFVSQATADLKEPPFSICLRYDSQMSACFSIPRPNTDPSNSQCLPHKWSADLLVATDQRNIMLVNWIRLRFSPSPGPWRLAQPHLVLGKTFSDLLSIWPSFHLTSHLQIFLALFTSPWEWKLFLLKPWDSHISYVPSALFIEIVPFPCCTRGTQGTSGCFQTARHLWAEAPSADSCSPSQLLSPPSPTASCIPDRVAALCFWYFCLFV